MRKAGRYVVIVAAMAVCVSVSASEKWPYFFSTIVEAGYDSNVSGLSKDFAGVESVESVDFFLDGERARRWSLERDRIADLGLGLTGWKREHGEGDFELENLAVHLRGDVDLPTAAAKLFHLERLTLGGQVERWDSRLGGRSFADSTTVTAAIQGTWEVTSICNFDNFLVFYESEDLDDGPVSDPALSRSGVHESIGIEFNLYLYGDYNQEDCRRPGILRRYVQSGITSLTFGYRNDDVDAASEYDARWNQIYFDARFPLQTPDGIPRTSLDISVGVAKVDYHEDSIFPPFIARQDTPTYYQTAFVRHFASVDFRLGYRWESNAASDVGRYAYERDYFFLGLNFELYNEHDIGRGSTGSGGSSSGVRGGQSGSSSPVSPGQGGG